MNAQIRIPFAQVEIKCARSQGIAWTRCHPVSELGVDLWFPRNHRRGWCPTGPLRLAPDRVGSWFVKPVSADGDTVPHGRPIWLNMVQIPSDRIYMDVTGNQTRARLDARRQKARMKSPRVCFARIIVRWCHLSVPRVPSALKMRARHSWR